MAADSAGGADEIRESRIDAHPALVRALGLERGPIYADCAALARKHPEYFAHSRAVKAHVDHVLGRPTHVLPGNRADHRLVVRREKENKAVALEITLRGGKYRVRSAHTLNEAQFQQKKSAAGPGATLEVSRVNPP